MRLRDRVAGPALRAGLRVSFKLPSLLPLPIAALRAGMDAGSRLFPLRQDVRIARTELGGVPAECLRPRGQTGTVVLHFHGGAFMAGSAQTHRAMGAELAARANAVVYMLEYRLAPEHAYPAALHDGLAAWQALLDRGIAAHDIVLGGDSGGCAHILSLAIALRDQGREGPAALFMMSPYIDITLSCPSVDALRRRDPMVTAHALRRGSDGYRGEIPAADPRVSPLFAELRGLPPILVQAGSEEILRDDATRLDSRLRAAGVSAECHVYPGMWHNFQMFSAFISSASRALDEVASFVKHHAGRHAGAAGRSRAA